MFIISRLGARPGSTSCPATNEKKPKVSTICNLGNFNDVLYHKASCTTYFFRGHSMWRMDNGKKASNRERISSKFPGLPGYIDAAYSRSDGSMVFFKSDRCVSCCITETNNVQRSREVGHYQNINSHSCGGGPYRGDVGCGTLTTQTSLVEMGFAQPSLCAFSLPPCYFRVIFRQGLQVDKVWLKRRRSGTRLGLGDKSELTCSINHCISLWRNNLLPKPE